MFGSPGGDPLVGLRLDVVAAIGDVAPAKAAVILQRPDSWVKVFKAASSN
jgi:hypothetical protein